ncbi:hypothetical protein L3Q82_009924, partial [Scortum barcoo]
MSSGPPAGPKIESSGGVGRKMARGRTLDEHSWPVLFPSSPASLPVYLPDQTTFPNMKANSESNQRQSPRSTPPLQNIQREQRNQVELFPAPSSPPDAEAAASGTVAPPPMTQRGIISVEPRPGLRRA